MVDFKPSDVPLHHVPLSSTFGRAEQEYAAALLVRTLQRRGNAWRPVVLTEVLAVAKEDGDARIHPLASALLNPFYRPDFEGLIAKGFAVQTSKSPTTIELTTQGLDVLRSYIDRCKAARAEYFFDGLDLSLDSITRPGPGDALGLRGEG